MKPLGVVFSDLHLSDYAKFNKDNQRTLSHFKVLKKIQSICIKNNIPAFFTGDLFHRPDVLSNEFFELVEKHFRKLDKKPWKLYAISGNHDCQLRNSLDKVSPTWVGTFSNTYKFLECIDFREVILNTAGSEFRIYGIPYLDHNTGINKAINEVPVGDMPTILMVHTDYPGAKDTDGSEVGTVENLNTNLLKPFKRVLSGHIHKPQRLGKKVYMVGAPLQQRRTDKNCKLGYWIIYEDFSLKFFELEGLPKFIDVDNEDQIKDDGNYYTIIASNSEPENTSINHRISKSISKGKLARRYCKATGIVDKVKQKVLVKILKETDHDTF